MVEIKASILTDDSIVYDVVVRVNNKKLVLCCTDKTHAENILMDLQNIISSVVHISIE